jgi:ribosome recycling factor
MLDELLLETEERMENAVKALERNLAKVRTGRANPKMFEGVNVDYYGVPTPLSQVGSVSVPEPSQILIKPYDRSLVKEIEKAILGANLNVNPQNEGDQLRITIPPLTEDRRKQYVKETKGLIEDARVALRNVRRDANDTIKKMEKNSDISEDDSKSYQDEVQKLTDQYVEKVDALGSAKEKDLMTV